MLRKLGLTLTGITVAAPALAHTGAGDATGLAHGFLHPIAGVDHVLAMVAVGLLACRLGGRALWLVPLSFMTLMAVGGALGMAGAALPVPDVLIALSLIVLGAVIAGRITMPVAAAMAVVGGFAIFHGHAHGSEMPESASGLAYGVGFVAATALLHLAGIGLGVWLGLLADGRARRVARFAGTAMALVGVGLLAG